MKTSILLISAFFLFLASTSIGGGNYSSDIKLNCAKKDDLKTLAPFQGLLKVDSEERGVAHIFKGLAPRFNPIKKSDLAKALTASSFLPKEHLERISSFNSVGLRLIPDEKSYEKGIYTNGEMLSSEQLKQLNNLPYSTNFVIDIHTGRYDPKNGITLGEDHYTPHFTLVPETQAEYKEGLGALYQFLRLNSQEQIDQIDGEKLGPGRIYVTVGKDGKLTNVELKHPSQQPALDERVLELMRTLPGEWQSARDMNGKSVEQTLVLFYGIMGC